MGVGDFLRELGRRHAALRDRIHSTKIILPMWGVAVMGAVYFAAPLIGGHYMMQYAINRSEDEIGGERATKLDIQAIRERRRTEQAAALRAAQEQKEARLRAEQEAFREELRREAQSRPPPRKEA